MFGKCNDNELQQRTGIEKSIAGQENSFKIDFRVQEEPHKVVLKDQGRTKRTQKLAHTLITCSRTEALITDLQKTDVCNTFSEESTRTIHNSGKSSYSNWVESLRRPNAHPVLNVGQKESCIAPADNAYCCQKNKDERRKNDLTHCQHPSSL